MRVFKSLYKDSGRSDSAVQTVWQLLAGLRILWRVSYCFYIRLSSCFCLIPFFSSFLFCFVFCFSFKVIWVCFLSIVLSFSLAFVPVLLCYFLSPFFYLISPHLLFSSLTLFCSLQFSSSLIFLSMRLFLFPVSLSG